MDVFGQLAGVEDLEDVRQVQASWIQAGPKRQQASAILAQVSHSVEQIRDASQHLHSLGFNPESLQYLRGLADEIDRLLVETHDTLTRRATAMSKVGMAVQMLEDTGEDEMKEAILLRQVRGLGANVG